MAVCHNICFQWYISIVFILFIATCELVHRDDCRLKDGSNNTSNCEHGCCPDVDHGGCCPCTVNSITLDCPTTTADINNTEPPTSSTTLTLPTPGLTAIQTTLEPEPAASTHSTLSIILIVLVCVLAVAVGGLSVALWRKRSNKVMNIGGNEDPLQDGSTFEAMTPPACTVKPSAV